MIPAMNRIEAMARLKAHAGAIMALGATSLYLFGSVARDESNADSDLDLFIDYDQHSRFNAFDLVGIKQYLEQNLDAEVDVTTRDSLHPMLRADIEKSAIRVF
jgi:predicted nucleotidyltransferase